jgi:exopolysaccharide biosynthesis predicted pyruvyltransferase EpsI
MPDMAFAISPRYLKQWEKSVTDKTLMLQRVDKEASDISMAPPPPLW